MSARRVRAGLASSGTLGLILTGLYGPLGVGSARDDADTRPSSGSPPSAPVVRVDARGGACPSGTSPSQLAPGLEACRVDVAPRAHTCARAEPLDALHVAPGGDGPGTREAPLGSIDAALRLAPAAAILLAAGDHAAPTSSIGARRIVGPCEGTARIVGALALSDGAALEQLTLEGPVRAQGEVSLSDVVMVSTSGPALEVLGGSRATLVDTRLEGALGLAIAADATVEATDVVARGAPAIAVSGPGATLSFSRLRARSPSGTAVRVEGGGLVRGEVLDARGARLALEARGEGTELTLEHAELHVPAGAASTIILDEHAHLRLVRSTVAAGTSSAALVRTARLSAEHVIMTGPSESLVVLTGGARGTLREVALVAPTAWAIDAGASTLEAQGFVVTSHVGAARFHESGAVHAHDGAQVSLEDGRVVAARGEAILVRGAHTSARVQRLEITRTRTAGCATSSLGCDGPPGGHAIAVTEGARLDVQASRVLGSDGCGLFVQGERSRVSVAASELRDNRVALCGDGASGDWLTLARDVALEDNESLLARPRLASVTPSRTRDRATD